MAIKLQIFILSIILGTCIENCTAVPGVCTLDDMKLLAAEACEHLFQNNVEHSKHKREVINNDIPKIVNETEMALIEDKRHHHGIVRVHRKDYPRGGYLLVNQHHAKVLSHMEHDPQYRVLPLKAHHRRMIEEMEESEHGIRDKRENNGGYVNVPYCCINKCRMDHFCRR